MKRTLTLLVLIGLVSGAMLTGCGDNSGNTTPPKTDTKTDTGTPATNAPAAPK
jgi:hypothetical protein